MSRASKRRKRKQRRQLLATASTDTPALLAAPGQSQLNNKGTYATACYHSTPTHVFDIGQSKIWAGTEAYIQDFPEPALIVDCSNLFGATTLLVPPGFEGLIKYGLQLPILQIPWPDGDLPEVKPEFWQELVKLLPAGNVYVCCAGGHGRTGTALAALRLLSVPATTVREAILEIRKVHCPEAIESDAQIKYLYDLGIMIGGLDMVNDCGLPRPRGTWQALTTVYQPFASSASPQRSTSPKTSGAHWSTLRGWASVGPDDAETDESMADPCADSTDADMLEHWPLSRTMTEAEIEYFRDNGTWPTAVWNEYDARSKA